jgi:hypothetical protein
MMTTGRKQKAIFLFERMIHFRQGKQKPKAPVPLRLLAFEEVWKKAQQGSGAAMKELLRRQKRHNENHQPT